MKVPIPLPQFLGLILGEIASVGPKTSLELFDRLNGRGVSAADDESVGLHAITLPLIQWACGQLEKRGCAMLSAYGWRFVAWPKTGTFGHVDSPTEQLAAAVFASEERVCKVAASQLVGTDKPPAKPSQAELERPKPYRSPPLRRQRAAETVVQAQAVAAVAAALAPPPTQAKPKAVVLDDPPTRPALKQASFF